jgi:H+/Cl- antiporter ClcA
MLTAAFLGTLFVTELRWMEKKRYFRVLIPSLTAAIAGFVIVFAFIGDTFLGVFSLPTYEIELWHFAVAIALGFLGATLSWLLGLTVFALRRWLIPLVDHRVLRATIGGVALGIAAMLLPLTLASGKGQLSEAIADYEQLGVAVLVASVLVKILTVGISLTTGFIGGPVMPTLFIGGAAGLAVHAIVPEVPIALAFSCMLVAVPGVSLGAPFTMLFLVALTVGLGAVEATPAGLAVLTAYTLNAGMGWFGLPAEKAKVDIDDPDVQTELFELGEVPPPPDAG